MSKTEQKKTKFIHDVKGPPVLTADVIEDIVLSRTGENLPEEGRKNPRRFLAQKYGVSEKRIVNIWIDYYGGSTLKHHASGLKKPLPTAAVKTADLTMRKFKSERGVYSARDPKIVEKADIRAIPVRKVVPMRKVKTPDLDLENTADMTDQEADIIQGEVLAGNNNPELLTAIAQLIKHNSNITERMAKSLEDTLKKKLKYSSSIETDETDNDDSTAYERRTKANPLRKVRPVYSDEEYETEEEQIGRVVRPSSGYYNGGEGYIVAGGGGEFGGDEAGVYSKPLRFVRGDDRLGQEYGARSARPGERARPLYYSERNRAELGPEEAGDISDPRHEQALPTTKYNAGQARIQSNNAHIGPKQHSQPPQSVGVPSGGGTRPIETVGGIPWLQKRRV
jgi:hypothetical protein